METEPQLLQDDTGRTGKEASVIHSWYCPRMCLKGLRKIMENLSHDTQYLIQDLN